MKSNSWTFTLRPLHDFLITHRDNCMLQLQRVSKHNYTETMFDVTKTAQSKKWLATA